MTEASIEDWTAPESGRHAQSEIVSSEAAKLSGKQVSGHHGFFHQNNRLGWKIMASCRFRRSKR
jgi:hypothetical protein